MIINRTSLQVAPQAVVFDWAGTTVDYGSLAPVDVFLEIFKQKGIVLTAKEVRGPMGKRKIDHVRALTQLPRVDAAWRQLYGKSPDTHDVDALYALFEPSLLKILPDYATPISGVVETVDALRERGLKIGSTTGYTDTMMAVLAPIAAQKGYAPDTYVTADHLPAGRPEPWMLYENGKRLGVNPAAIIKVGDTIADIQEGVNAGAYSVGVVVGSSQAGLRQEEADALDKTESERIYSQAEQAFSDAGAHAVIRTMPELLRLYDTLAADFS
jgi:phosphonoacetaldehyde hydrolase